MTASSTRYENFYRVLLLAFAVSFTSSCAPTGTRAYPSGMVVTTGGTIPDLIRARQEREQGPLPESTWNRYKIWKKIQSSPPTYIPSEYSISSPRTKAAGKWYVDHRDGKRLFAPYNVDGRYSAGILAVEASKIVDWQYSKGKKWYRSVNHQP